MEATKMSRVARVIIYLIGFWLSALNLVLAQPRADIVRKSTVYIYFDVTDIKTGEKSINQGTAFIISERGYLLTASHLFRAWMKQSDAHKEKNIILGTLGDQPGFVTSA